MCASSTPSADGSSRSAKRRKLRLMCVDLTGEMEQADEDNGRQQYELSDVKDSCQIEFNGQKIEVNVKQMTSLFKLGEGNFARVTLVQLQDHPSVVLACKRISMNKDGNNIYSSMIDTDLRTMRRISNDHHPHIVHFYGALIDSHDEQLLICMEPMETSLERFYPILHSHFQFSPTQLDLFLRRLAKHIVLALDYLKSKDIIHRDVKPQNMLMSRQLIYKLCDFGICGTLKDSLSSTHLGSMRYLPPERLGGNASYGTRSDMWALGMSLLEISEGSLPLSSEPIMSFMFQMKNGWQPQLPSTLDQDTRDLIAILLRHNVDQRPRYYSEILSMPSLQRLAEAPSQEEFALVHSVLDALPPRTPE